MARLTPASAELTNGRLTFAEQLAAIQRRTRNLVPTQRWTDLMRSAHDRGWVVAGAQKADLLADFAGAVERVIAEGKSIQWFRENFDQIVERHGWAYRGERNWRTRVIYRTNVATTYAAGRLAQLRDPALRAVAPFWMYKHGGSTDPRPEHLAWDGITLPADDEWFRTHYPPNGWGCSCRVVAVREKDIAALGGRRVENPPAGTEGIDRGWDYMPGDTVADELRGIAAKTATLPPDLGVAFGAENQATIVAAWEGWVDQVLEAPRSAGRTAVLAVMRESELAFLRDRGRAPVRTDISVEDRLLVGRKARRHEAAGDSLSVAEWRSLARRLRSGGEATLYDNDTGHLLYVLPSLDDARRIKIVVAPDFTGRGAVTLNSTRTVFRVDASALRDPRKYTVIAGGIGE